MLGKRLGKLAAPRDVFCLGRKVNVRYAAKTKYRERGKRREQHCRGRSVRIKKKKNHEMSKRSIGELRFPWPNFLNIENRLHRISTFQNMIFRGKNLFYSIFCNVGMECHVQTFACSRVSEDKVKVPEKEGSMTWQIRIHDMGLNTPWFCSFSPLRSFSLPSYSLSLFISYFLTLIQAFLPFPTVLRFVKEHKKVL